jgi:hypothetical protein
LAIRIHSSEQSNLILVLLASKARLELADHGGAGDAIEKETLNDE